MNINTRSTFVLGISGSAIAVNDSREDWPNNTLLDEDQAHDSAAVLVSDGGVIFGVEEERLNRLKHSNRIPINAIQQCLKQFTLHRSVESDLHIAYYSAPKKDVDRARTVDFIVGMATKLGIDVDRERVHLVGHHYCHAASAFFCSPFKESLVVSIDGQGDGLCASVSIGRGTTLETVKEIPWQHHSLGRFYKSVTRYLGFGVYDEYKVMGLAPYGDPARYRSVFAQCFDLLEFGDWKIRLAELPTVLHTQLGEARKPSEPVLQHHMDIAASLQEGLEKLILHILAFYKTELGQTNLCLAGGVALNCTANSRILNSGLFEDVFVQPAAHDGGGALGAALSVHAKLTQSRLTRPLQHVYWGAAIDRKQISVELEKWKAVLDVERRDDVFSHAAALIEAGNVLGWVSGRSEFGPRALGNRSILADPRPASHKELINSMVKKREAFRPFAPAILEEAATEYFSIPAGRTFPWMIFVAEVRQDKRNILGAVTHVDGSARVQTVAQDANPQFWQLLKAFQKRTGVPVLLNTSFNNNAEPIVESIFDSIVCFLTTGLDFLVIEDYVIRKKTITATILGDLILSVAPYTRVDEVTQYGSDGKLRTYQSVSNRYVSRKIIPISAETTSSLRQADGKQSIRELLSCPVDLVLDELIELWSQRLIVLKPV